VSIGTVKRLRKQHARLLYRVEIAELEQRLSELQQQREPMGFRKKDDLGLYVGAFLDKKESDYYENTVHPRPAPARRRRRKAQ